MATNLTKILVLTSILFNFILSNSSKQLQVEVMLGSVQSLSLINKKKFPDLSATNYNDGFIELQGCIELEVKSNIPWMLIAKDATKFESNQSFQIKTSGGVYKPVNLNQIELVSSSYQTSSEIIRIDCKRMVDWNKTKPGKWNYSPEFELISLGLGGSY
tara:strand:- start:3486 stop:3962 length:477 start_codon:yes stop_codon:yes gene_type:complete